MSNSTSQFSYFYTGASNVFMIFTMLLIGTLFIGSLSIGDLFFDGKIIVKLYTFIKTTKIASMPAYLIDAITILSFYALGHMIYLASYIFIGLPGWKVMQIIFKSDRLYAGKIVDEILKNGERSDEMFKQSSIFFKRSLLYLYIRSQESNSSSDVKFSFTQLMYGRSILLIINITLFVFYIVTLDSIIMLYTVIFYVISIILYAIGLRFF